jgi:aspartyl-tRNA(Asn)/glutamyl-tRNA(Gln) amidotransferase subunit A
VEPEVAAICERAAQRFSELGCEVEEAAPGFGNQSMTFLNINTPSDAVWIGDFTDEQRSLMDQPAGFFFENGKKVTGTDVVRANLERMRVWQQMQDFHQKYDLLLTPVVSCTAFPVGAEPKQIGGKDVEQAASLPCGFDANGLPVGLHVIGRAYADSLVLRACRAFEELQPWGDRKPEIAT